MTIIPDVGLRVLRALTLQDLESLTSRDPLLADLPVEEFAAAILESSGGRAAGSAIGVKSIPGVAP